MRIALMNSRHPHPLCPTSSKGYQHLSPASRLIVRTQVSFGLPLLFFSAFASPVFPSQSILPFCKRDLKPFPSRQCDIVIYLLVVPLLFLLGFPFETICYHLTPRILRKTLSKKKKEKTRNFLSVVVTVLYHDSYSLPKIDLGIVL